MNKEVLIEKLRTKHKMLLKAYIFHVGWFTSTFASAATETTQLALPTLLILTLITVPPVLFYTVAVHKTCRAIEPSARSVGLWPVVICTILFTPFESGLVLPLKNLWVSRCILRTWDKALTRASSKGPSGRDAQKTRAP